MGTFIHTWMHWISKLGSGSLIYSTGIFYQLHMEAETCMTYKVKQVISLFVHETGSVSQKKTEGRKLFNNILAFCCTLTKNSLE